MEREVWRERGCQMDRRGSWRLLAWRPFEAQLCMFFFSFFHLGSWCAFLCLLGATWMQKRFKIGLRVILLDNKS